MTRQHGLTSWAAGKSTRCGGLRATRYGRWQSTLKRRSLLFQRSPRCTLCSAAACRIVASRLTHSLCRLVQTALCRTRWWSVLCSCNSSSSKFQMPSADVIEAIKTIQETQLMLTNPRDAFRGQSRSPNMVPFDVVSYGFLLVCYSNFVRKIFEIFDFRNAVTFKAGLWVRQGHWKYHHPIECIWLPIDIL